MKQTNQPESKVLSKVNTDSMNFVAFLDESLHYVDAWTPTKVNSGGCGVFAYLLIQHLEKLNISYKIFALYFQEDADSAKTNLKKYLKSNTNIEKAGAEHVCVLIENTLYIDSHGVINAEVMNAKEKLELTKDVLKTLIDKGDWNPTFDRKCEKVMENKFDEVFKHINDFHPGIFKFPTKSEVKYTPHTMTYMRREMGGFGAFINSLRS